MKLDVNTVLKDYTGQALKAGPEGGEEITIAKILMQVATLGPVPGKTYSAEEQVIRYHLGYDAFNAQENEPHEIKLGKKVIAILCEDVSRSWNPIVAGQFLSMLGVKKPDDD